MMGAANRTRVLVLLVVVGIVLALTAWLRGGPATDESVIVASLGTCPGQSGEPVLLPDLFAWNGVWWTMDTEDLSIVASGSRSGSSAVESYPDGATEIGSIGTAEERRSEVVVADYLVRELGLIGRLNGQLLARSSVGGDKSRSYALLREMAYVDAEGSVTFAGPCARFRFTDVLEAFRQAAAANSTGIEVVSRLLRDEDLREELNGFVYGG